jgi:hypothetical protein
MKRIFFNVSICFGIVELQNGSTATNNSKTDTNLVQVSINLNDVKEDKVLVTITAPK